MPWRRMIDASLSSVDLFPEPLMDAMIRDLTFVVLSFMALVIFSSA
jgi:hypothetical protein